MIGSWWSRLDEEVLGSPSGLQRLFGSSRLFVDRFGHSLLFLLVVFTFLVLS